jgi:hypothetical protein
VPDGGDRRIAVWANLAVLYWQATDFGLSTAKQLDPAFVTIASQRSHALLAEAAATFPGSTEVRFWGKYIEWASWGGNSPREDECRGLLLEDPTTLAPAMHVFAQSEGMRCEPEALQRLEQCREEATTRAGYIASVIEGALGRRRPRVKP